MNIAYNWKKKCRTFSDAGKIVSNIESDLCFYRYYHCLNSAGSMDYYLWVMNLWFWYIFLTILSPTLYIEKQSEANRVGGRVPDYQLLWNNTGAWSAGHCSKLRMNHGQRKNLWCEVLHQRGHYKSDIGQFGVSKNMRLHSKSWTHQFIPWV